MDLPATKFLLFVGLVASVSIGESSQLATGNNNPAYSLQNMPRTDFSCRDKILGGYYADTETHCQMFHVCVKVAGVGVQDFRFLCPNGTAFDQEAQTCADWGDVDCEQASLFGDNFDLYRIGFESKRSSVGEDEDVFHLQRAESNDARRSKEHSSHANKLNRADKQNTFIQHHRLIDETSIRPAKQYQSQAPAVTSPRPTSTTTKTTTTTTFATPQQANRQSSLFGQDEIFKGSHSSNFYSNRNSAGLDDDEDFKQTTSNAKKSRQRQRGRVQYRNPVPSTSSPPPIALSSTHNIKLTVFNASQSTNRPSFVSSTTPAPFRFTFTPSIQPNRPNELLNLSPIGPLQKQYQQPNYNTTPSVLSQPVVSVPTPFNTNHKPSNTFNAKHFNVPQLPSTQVPPFSQKTNRPFDNNNPINNYQTSSPFAHQSQSKFNHNQLVGVAIGNNFQFNRTAQALPSTNNATNFHQTNFGTPNFPQNFQPNLQRAPTTTSTTTTTLKPPTFNQQDYLLNYRQEQQQRQKAPQFGSSVDTQARIEQQRRLHYDINDYLTASKNDVQGQYSPTSEQYRSIQTFPTHPSIDRNSGDNFTPKYIQSFPSAATPTTPSTTTTTRQQYEPYKQYHEMMRQQQQQQQRTSFNNQSQRPSNVATPTKTPSFNANTNQNNVVNTASTKKFSTLVPKQFYAPTTFKPFYFNVAKQINENLSSSTTMATTTARTVPNASPPQRQASNFNQPIAQARPQFIQSTPKSVIVEGIDEDDGQYHPELYEKDFARYKIKNRKKTQQTQQPQFSQVNQFNRNLQPQTQRGSAFHIAALSNEEEFLSTAHSQNIAASGNELRNAAKQSALKQTSNGVAKPNGNQSTSHAKPTTTKPSTTKPSTSKPSSATRSSKNQHNDDDTSYDYAYYDTGSSHVQSDYNEYDVSDFGKAKKAKN